MTIHQKINFGGDLNDFAERKIKKALQLKGKILPVFVNSRSGHMINVSFDLTGIPYTLPDMTIPIFGPEYVRYPIQPGCKGIAVPADTYLGGTSGLGGGVASLDRPANLSSLLFIPISNTEWQDVDYSVLTLYGPEGVTIRDAGSNTTFMLTPEAITIAAPQKYEVTTGGTKLLLTPSGWSLAGTSGSVQDSAGKTSPALMQKTWESLKAWVNSHEHPNGAGGSPTGSPTSTFSENITE